MRRLSLADGECITRTFQNQSLYTLPDTNQLHLWRKVLSMQLKLSLLYKQWNLGGLQAAMKSDMKCSKPWIEKFFGWLRCARPAWCYGRAWIDWQTEVIILSDKEEAGVNAWITGACLSLASLEKYKPIALKKNATKQLNHRWTIPGLIFFPAVTTNQPFREIIVTSVTPLSSNIRHREMITPQWRF